MQLSEYAKFDGLGLAELVQRRKVSPEELVGAALAAIEAVNTPELGYNATTGPVLHGPTRRAWRSRARSLGSTSSHARWVQFVGRWSDEATLFRLAGQLEQARPWAQRTPPIHVSTARGRAS